MGGNILGNLIVQLLGDTTKFDRSMTSAQKKMAKVSQSLTAAGRKLTMFVTLPIAGIGTAALVSAAKMEKHKIAFETMLGSAEKAQELLPDIEEFSASTPFQLPGLIEGSKRLLAFGIQSEDIVEKMRNLGNAAMGDEEILGRLVIAYGKMAAKGKVSLEELNMFTEAGVPILQGLEDQLGYTKDELFAMITQGKVTFEDVDEALTNMTTGTGQFAGMIEEQAGSLAGIFSTLKDNVGLLTREFAEFLMPAIKNFLEKALGFVQRINDMDDRTKKLILAVVGIAAAIGPLLLIVGKAIKTFQALKIAMVSLNAVMSANPILAIVTAVALLATGAYILIKNWDRVKGFFTKVFEGIRDWIMKTPDWVTYLITAFAPFIGLPMLLIKNWDSVAAFLINTWNSLAFFAQEAFNLVKVAILKSMVVVLEGLIKLREKFGGEATKMRSALETLNGKITETTDVMAGLEKPTLQTAEAIRQQRENNKALKEGAEETNKVLEEMQDEQEGLKKKIEETTGAQDDQKNSTEDLADTYVAGYFPPMRTMSEFLSLYVPKVDRTTEAHENLKDETWNLIASLEQLGATGRDMSDLMATTWVDAFANMYETTGSFGRKIKDTVKNMVATMIKAFADSLFATGVALLLNPFTIGQGIRSIAAAAALRTVALGVENLQKGALVVGETFARIGEGKDKEVVLPLNDEVFDNLARGILDQIGKGDGTAAGRLDQIETGRVTDREIHFHVGTLIADELGLKRLERKLREIRVLETARIGG